MKPSMSGRLDLIIASESWQSWSSEDSGKPTENRPNAVSTNRWHACCPSQLKGRTPFLPSPSPSLSQCIPGPEWQPKSWQIFSNYLQFKRKSLRRPHTHPARKLASYANCSTHRQQILQ